MTYGPVIPGQTQGTTPPFFPQQDDRAKQILDFIMKASSQRRFAGQPRPAAVPGLSDPAQAQQIGLNTSNPHGWGAERFMGGLQAMMRNAVAMSKERQINKAMADWDYAQSSLNEYYSIDQQDQNAVQQWHHKYDWFWQDEKKLKNMAKSLNQDWLNPEKTTVHGEALKRKAAQVQETSQKKNAAATGIKNMFKSLLGRQQQPQLSPQEKGAQEQEIIGRAPTTSGLQSDQLKMIVPFLNAEERAQAQRDVEHMKEVASKEIEEMKEKARKELQKPVDKVLSDAAAAYEKGDMEGYKAKLSEAQGMTTAAKGPGPMNQFTLLQKANQGDKDAAKILHDYWDEQTKLAQERGKAFGMGRAMFNIQPYINDQGQIVPMSSFDAANAIKAGQTLTPSGKLSATTVQQVQRLVSEATPAIKGASQYLKTFDSAEDRAIFARILSSNPAAVHGQEASWLGNILDQALTQKLSDDGKHYVQQMRRLSDSLGLLRATMGLPATETMTALTLQLVPGPSTPDSKFAREQIGLLEQMITNAVEIPSLKGVTGSNKVNAPPKGAKIRDYTDIP